MNISNDLLHLKLKNVLIKSGIKEYDAQIAAEVLIEGNLRNYLSHGVDRVFQILEGLKHKTINPNACAKILVDLPGVSVIDGDFGLGYLLGKKAMELAVEKAKRVGVGVVGVINTSHLGVLAYYSEIASRNGCIGVVMSTTSPAVVIKGGKMKTFGTNPISYSMPYNPYPITADFATSKVSRGVICDQVKKGKTIPVGWAVDAEGNETTDPNKALEGGLTTIDGDIKGSLLSFWVSIMAGPLIGGVNNPAVTGTRYMDKKPNKGDLFMAFNIEGFTDTQAFADQLDELLDFINNQKAEFRAPGERDHQHRVQQLKNDICISNELAIFFEEHDDQ